MAGGRRVGGADLGACLWVRVSVAGEGGGFPQPGAEGRRADQPTIPPDQKKRFLSRLQQMQAGMADPGLSGVKGPLDGGEEGGPKKEGLPNGMEPGKDAGAESLQGGAAPMMPGGMPLGFGNANANMQLLSACALRSIPHAADSAWSGPSAPRVRAPVGVAVPPSYPTVKMPLLENPALFEKLDSEALFFAFYHQPGTYQQYLAARELKRQSWR